MSEWRPYRIGFFGSLNEDRSPARARRGELSVALNCAQDGRRFGTRPGLEREAAGANAFDAQTAANDTVQGIHEFQDHSDSGHIICNIENKIHYGSDGGEILNVGAITLTAGQDNHWTYAEHNDNLYGAGGVAGDDVWKWDGDTGNAVAAVTVSTTGATLFKYIHQQFNYGFIAGMDGTAADDNPMVVRYSSLNDMDTWPTGNTIGGSSAIGGFDSFGGNEITGLAEHQDNNGHWLMVLTKRRLYPVIQTPSVQTPFYIQPPVQNGCVTHKAFVSLGLDSGDAIYMSENGIHSLRQSQQYGGRADKFLSWPIRNTFRGLARNRFDSTSAAYDPVNGRVLFLVAEAGETNQNMILVCEIKDVDELTPDNVRWRIWRLHADITPNMLGVARDASDGEPMVYLGDIDGNVYRFNADAHQDVETDHNYDVRWRTHDDSLGLPGQEKNVGDIYVDAGPGGTYTPTVSAFFDYGSRQSGVHNINLPSLGSLWDTAVWDTDAWSSEEAVQQQKFYGSGRGHTVSFQFEHDGINEPFYVYDFMAQIRTVGESVGTEE